MLNAWYGIIDLLPFEWTGYIFMKNALLAVLLVTPILGLLGTMIVNNKMSFFSDALGHSALTGVGLGVFFGMRNTDISMVLFAVIFAIGIVFIKHNQKAAMDTTIGVFSSTAVALGIVLLSGGGFNKYSNLLIGDLLSITGTELVMLFGLLIVVVLAWAMMFNTLLIVSASPTFAISRGISTRTADIVFTTLIALVVTLSIKWVGLLIINSLFILPAATSRMLSQNMRQYTVVSVVISLVCGVVGLFTSYYLNTSAGATIALYCAGTYFIVLVFLKKM